MPLSAAGPDQSVYSPHSESPPEFPYINPSMMSAQTESNSNHPDDDPKRSNQGGQPTSSGVYGSDYTYGDNRGQQSHPPQQGQQQAQQPQHQQQGQQGALPMMYYPYSYVPPPSSPEKPKRNQVKNACTNCQKACKKCDEERPCGRCTRYGLHDCQDSERKKRTAGSKRGPYRRRTSAPAEGHDMVSQEPEPQATVSNVDHGNNHNHQQHSPAFPYPMYPFPHPTGHHTIQPGLFAVYGYSTNGIPLGPDGQPIQFGTHYNVPIGFLATGVPVPPPPSSHLSGHSPPGQSSHASETGAHNSPSDAPLINPTGDGSVDAAQTNLDSSNPAGYDRHDYPHGYPTSPPLPVTFVEQQTTYSQAFSLPGYDEDNVTLADPRGFHPQEQVVVEETNPIKSLVRRRKISAVDNTLPDPHAKEVAMSPEGSGRKKRVKKSTTSSTKRSKKVKQSDSIRISPGISIT